MAGWIEEAVADGGYGALGGLLVLENLFPPIPSEVILPLAGFYVDRGTLSFLPAVLVATLGSLVGAYVLYAVGRYGGRPALERWGRYLRITDAQLDRADAWFDRRGTWIVLFGRLIPGIRSVVSVPAGAAEMPVPKFLALTAAGSLTWNVILIGTGVALGAQWEDVEQYVGPAGRIAVGLLVLAVLALLARHLLLRRRRAA